MIKAAMKNTPKGIVRALVFAGFVASAGSAVAADAAAAAKEVIETVVVELGPDGFYPKQIQRKAGGKFYLFIRVNLGREAVTLQMEDENKASVMQADQSNNGKRWGPLVDVKAGKYVLRAKGKSNWTLDITVP